MLDKMRNELIASQAKCIHLSKSLKAEVQRCCANIYFNRQCLKQGVDPKYAQIKFPYTSPASKITPKMYMLRILSSIN